MEMEWYTWLRIECCHVIRMLVCIYWLFGYNTGMLDLMCTFTEPVTVPSASIILSAKYSWILYSHRANNNKFYPETNPTHHLPDNTLKMIQMQYNVAIYCILLV